MDSKPAPTLSRRELLEQYKKQRQPGHSLQSRIQQLKGTPSANPAASKPTHPTVDRAKVQQAGSRAVAPGTPVHALQKRLKTGPLSKPATLVFDKKEAAPSRSRLMESKPSRPLAPSTGNRERSPVKKVPPVTSNPVKGKGLLECVEEASQLARMGFAQAARALLEGMARDPKASGKALYWAARARLEEEQGDWSAAASLLEQGRGSLRGIEASVIKASIHDFEARRAKAAAAQVDGLLDDEDETHTTPSKIKDERMEQSPAEASTEVDLTKVKVEGASERLNFARLGKALETHMGKLGFQSPAAKALQRTATVKTEGDAPKQRVFRAGNVSRLREMFEKGALTGAVALPGMTSLSMSDSTPKGPQRILQSETVEEPMPEEDATLSRYLFDDGDEDDADLLSEDLHPRGTPLRVRASLLRSPGLLSSGGAKRIPTPRQPLELSPPPPEDTIEMLSSVSEMLRQEEEPETATAPKSMPPSSLMPPPPPRLGPSRIAMRREASITEPSPANELEDGRRKGTPMPDRKKPARQREGEVCGSFTAHMAATDKDGGVTTTPVRRSSRLSQLPTPSPIRREMEHMVVTTPSK